MMMSITEAWHNVWRIVSFFCCCCFVCCFPVFALWLVCLLPRRMINGRPGKCVLLLTCGISLFHVFVTSNMRKFKAVAFHRTSFNGSNRTGESGRMKRHNAQQAMVHRGTRITVGRSPCGLGFIGFEQFIYNLIGLQ